MIYILTQIYNYSQIEKITPEVTGEIKEAVTSLARTQRCVLETEKIKEGLFLFIAGEEEKNDPRRIADIIFHIHRILHNNKKFLHGYNTLISLLEHAPPSQIIALQKANLYLLEEEDNVWISQKEISFFTKCLTTEKKGNFYKISMKKDQFREDTHKDAPFWLRKSSYNELFDEITPVINGINETRIIYISGDNGVGKTTTASCIIQSILEEDYEHVPRMHTLFKKQSFVHPFLSSISLDFIEQVPQFLKDHEKSIWTAQGKLLIYLKSGNETRLCPDHLFEDFLISYNLYLTAYIRMMTKKLKPSFFICDDLEAYTKKAYNGLHLLLKDFLQNPSFIPIFISQSENIPEIFSSFPIKKVHIKALNQREVRQCVHTLYPGIKITKKVIKKLLIYAKGQILPVKSFCAFCLAKGIIKKEKNSYSGDIEKSPEFSSGFNQSRILISLIQSVKQNELDILFYIYLSAGMLSKEGLFDFLKTHGYEKSLVQGIINNLSLQGLVSTGNYITPYYPGLKKRIEEILQSRTFYLSDLYLNYIINLWQQKKYNRHVLLFSLFMTHKKTALALEVLYSLIKKKIDEGELQEAKPFLSMQNPVIKYDLEEEEQKQLLMIILAAQLRIALLEENIEYGTELVKQIEEELLTIDFVSSYRGDLYLQLAAYYHLEEENDRGVNLTKKALLDYQDLGLPEKKAHAYIELGSIMLAEEKIKDAHDYLTLSLRLFPEDFKFPHNKLHILVCTGISFYLQGNISKSLQLSLEASTLAQETGKRDWELLSIFFAGRIYFDLGLYENAQAQFLKGLNLTSMYTIKNARKVLIAWLGRTYIYSGKMKEGLKNLNMVKANKEIYFVLSEAYFFLKQYDKALGFSEKSLSIEATYPRVPDEKIEWVDGFSLIEGKYSKPSSRGAVFQRLLKIFRAYLLSHCRGLKEGIAEFYAVLRTGRDNKLDPYYSLYYFLYSQLLQKSGEDETDDYLTILNKALKQLQERASRIETPSDRTKYLFNNFWNTHIFNEAKKKNLV